MIASLYTSDHTKQVGHRLALAQAHLLWLSGGCPVVVRLTGQSTAVNAGGRLAAVVKSRRSFREK